MNREEQAAFGRIGALTAHSRHSADEMLTGARAGFRERFRRQVDPEGTLDPAERERRAGFAMRAYMTALATRRARTTTAGAVDPPAAVLHVDGRAASGTTPIRSVRRRPGAA